MAMLTNEPTNEPLKTPVISQERLKYFLTYDPDTGIFTWNLNYFNMKKGARLTSTINTGKIYNRVKLDKKTYKLSRLAFLYMTGSFPVNLVDHINGDSLDDRWCNLREATYLENSQNCSLPTTNTSGIKGLSRVTINKNKYLMCQVSGTKKYFKPHQEEEAITWVKETRESLHGAFAKHG